MYIQCSGVVGFVREKERIGCELLEDVDLAVDLVRDEQVACCLFIVENKEMKMKMKMKMKIDSIRTLIP